MDLTRGQWTWDLDLRIVELESDSRIVGSDLVVTDLVQLCYMLTGLDIKILVIFIILCNRSTHFAMELLCLCEHWWEFSSSSSSVEA